MKDWSKKRIIKNPRQCRNEIYNATTTTTSAEEEEDPPPPDPVSESPSVTVCGAQDRP